jgi:hypothetical protein
VEPNDVEEVLAEAELVACLQATLPEAKQIRDACLADEIPVVLDRGACCGSSGCGCAPKIQVLARQEDLPRVLGLVHRRWQDLAMREGTIDLDHPSVAPAGQPDEMPCPACGTAAPLVGGACTDCGLQLESP